MARLDAGLRRLHDLMADDARRGGGVSTCSNATHAERLGVCSRTIRRWKCQLAEQGEIVHDGYHQWAPKKRTVRWRVTNVPQGIKTTGTRGGPRTFRISGPGTSRANTRHYGRRRRLMEEHPDIIRNEGIVRKSGEVTPPNAADAVAMVVDWFRLKGVPITRQAKGQVARQSKALLEDGFEFDVVVHAAILAIRRGGPHLQHYIAGDLVAAQKGEWIPTRDEYRKKLEDEIEIRREEMDRVRRELEEAGIEGRVWLGWEPNDAGA